jgi:hypothetical protein
MPILDEKLFQAVKINIGTANNSAGDDAFTGFMNGRSCLLARCEWKHSRAAYGMLKGLQASFSIFLHSHSSCKGSMACCWKVTDIEHEVDAMQNLLQARPTLLAKRDTVKKPVLAKLERMDALASQDFLALYKIFETAKLPGDLKNEFLQVLDTKATAGTSRETLQAGKTQVIETLPQYFTAGELALLEKQDMWSGALVVAKRLKLLGVTTMRESTKKIGTSMLVSFEHLRAGAVPCADACYVLSQHFTTAFHQCGVRVPAGVVMLAKYPLDPFDLAPAHLAASYPEEKPANAILPMLGQCRKNVAVRDTHKGVTKVPCIFYLVLDWKNVIYSFFKFSLACKACNGLFFHFAHYNSCSCNDT